MKRFAIYFVFVAACMLPSVASAQDFEYTWTVIPVTAEYDEPGDTPVSRIVDNARKGLEYLNEVLAVSAKEMAVSKPESPLSNLTADIILDRAEMLTGLDIDCSLYNMGGIRITIPEGNVTMGDIISCYPFRNTLVVAEMTGDRLLDFFTDFAAMKQPEAISGVTMEVSSDGALLSVLVGGEEIDPVRTYRMASISFLVSGGDGFFLEKYADNVIDSGVQVKDAVVSYCKDMTKEGRKLDAEVEGRYIIVE